MVTSCEQQPILFDTSNSVVGFSRTSLVVKENATGEINIFLGGALGAATDVVVEVDVTGIANPAVEGVDFNLSTKSLSMTVGESAIVVTPVDNDVFGGDLKFGLKIVSNSAGYMIAVQDMITVTISDDEHPLKSWIGTYDVAAPSYTVPGAWDEAWEVTTSPVEGEPDQLQLDGVGLNGTGLIATFDTDAMTITIAPGQDIGLAYADWGYDVVGSDEVTVYFGYPDLTWDDELDIVGAIEANGNMTIDGWCHIMGGYVWDVFNTTWTKQ